MVKLRIIRILFTGNLQRFGAAAISRGQRFREAGKGDAFFQFLLDTDNAGRTSLNRSDFAISGF
ncbi:Uncharacterised protein [Klebsiella pneumoniae]|nr:Uncharacterised protein [Klebsiella pneumoniae]